MLNREDKPGEMEFEELIKTLSRNSTQTALFPAYKKDSFVLYNDDCLDVMRQFPSEFIDMIFADPPYLLSNNGITCQSGKMADVNKGTWDKSGGLKNDLHFHESWLTECRRILKPGGTIWISGTYHNIYQCGFLLQKMQFHLLNDIAWFKPNASPNLSCRFFTASHETLLWARKDKKAKHYFNYKAMKEGEFPEDNLKKPNSQMRSVWSMPSPALSEKKTGKHPTQKPLALLRRIILASTKRDDIILDPFCGAGTTGIATLQTGERKFIGIEINDAYIDLTVKRINLLKRNDKETGNRIGPIK